MDTSASDPAAYFSADTCELDDFLALVSRSLSADEVPLAVTIEKNIPIYDMSALRTKLGDPGERQSVMAEWAYVLHKQSGVIVLRNAYKDTTAIDAASEVYKAIIAKEKASAGGGADHFAAAGNNDRIWNSLQKLAEESPEIYIDYFSNPVIDAASEAWLGPNYQMTAQVNLVYPGGAAQLAHRDYHLGFQTAEISASYPAHVHELSPVLTLQGAIAHCDMPIESGATKLLPFSQQYRPGYSAWRRDDFRACFEERYVQLPLAKGDALFFNPALFHAAGENRSSDIERLANLLQVSSAFGRAMEVIDRQGMSVRLYPLVQQALKEGKLDAAQLHALIAATAEGYSFPTNLDRDPPIDGLAPETQHALFKRALDAAWDVAAFESALVEQSGRCSAV